MNGATAVRFWDASSRRVVALLVVGEACLFLLAWNYLSQPLIPKPWDVTVALGELWSAGIVGDLLTSLWLYVEALGWATLLSAVLAYAAEAKPWPEARGARSASLLALLRPPTALWSKLRFIGMSGLPFLFTLWFGNPHRVKLAMLVFGMSVFMVPGMRDVLASIPQEKYDLARTLRMSEWQVIWEVMVRGRVDVLFDVVRENGAMGYLMLSFVEGLFRGEGGLGAVLATQDRLHALDKVLALQVIFVAVGLAQDAGLGWVKRITCPYANLLTERR